MILNAVKSTALRGFLLLAAVAGADKLEEGLSFGHLARISPNLRGIPGWHIEGIPQEAQILSDRVILTPPYPGNRRASLWADNSMPYPEWTADFEFRATGPDRGGGNLQIWYAKDGPSAIGTSSIYTVGQFDGLVLVVDTYGGRGGTIRAFLNDGTTDFKSHHSIDSLSFGHCDYPYRNLGRLTRLQLKQTDKLFQVNVDDKLCFQTEKVKLPSAYKFGISAASAETPDSFEVYKFLVHSASTFSSPPPESHPDEHPNSHQSNDNHHNGQPITTSDHLSGLESRLNSLAGQIDSLERILQSTSTRLQTLQNTLSQQPPSGNNPKTPSASIPDDLAPRLSSVESILNSIQHTLASRSSSESQIIEKVQHAVSESHSNLMAHLPTKMGHAVRDHAPRIGVLVFAVVVVQVLVVMGYVVYKRRRANAPKKYL
ncbi:MAG: hypothetical protein M1817_001248 [Caeruleum heppii]|nr:MAG: hypothetical protein M1817_001248 [Caeruleum heppii]